MRDNEELEESFYRGGCESGETAGSSIVGSIYTGCLVIDATNETDMIVRKRTGAALFGQMTMFLIEEFNLSLITKLLKSQKYQA